MLLKELNQVIEYIEDHLTDDCLLKVFLIMLGFLTITLEQIFFHLSGMTLK